MAGIFKDQRHGLISKANRSTTWTDIFLNKPSTLFLPSGRPLDSVTGAVTTGSNIGSLGVTIPVPMASVTSYRSGPKYDSRIPEDPRSYRADLIEKSKTGTIATDRGHEFDSVKQQLISFDTNKEFHASWGGSSEQYVYSGEVAFRGLYNGTITNGPLLPYFNGGGTFVFPTVPDVSLTYGTKLIAQANPTKANASLMTGLLELRDGIPKFPGLSLGHVLNKKELARAGSDEFLNYVFGIVPTVGDIKKILKSIVDFNKIINQYSKDADKIVRRRKALPPLVSTNIVRADVSQNKVVWFPVSTISNSSPPMGSVSNLEISDSKFDRIWFSGAFRYHLPIGDSAFANMDRLANLANKLLGSNLDPHSLWSALPWSWLVDWFVDVGDIIQNGTQISQYGGVMQYGYLMCESTYNRTYTINNLQLPGGYKTDLTTSLMTKRKQRRKATPYGFGLNPGTFSDQQWAILGALGISKGPKSLW